MTDDPMITNKLLDSLEFLDLAPTPSLSPTTSTAPPPPLDNPSPDQSWESESSSPLPLVREPTMSPVLQRLSPAQRPPTTLACSTCPGAVWLAGGALLQAFCMVTRTVSWSRDEPIDITMCDGREQALLAREMEMRSGA